MNEGIWTSRSNLPPMIRMISFEEGAEVLVNLDHVISILDEKSNTTAYKKARIILRDGSSAYIRGSIDDVWKALHGR